MDSTPIEPRRFPNPLACDAFLATAARCSRRVASKKTKLFAGFCPTKAINQVAAFRLGEVDLLLHILRSELKYVVQQRPSVLTTQKLIQHRIRRLGVGSMSSGGQQLHDGRDHER